MEDVEEGGLPSPPCREVVESGESRCDLGARAIPGVVTVAEEGTMGAGLAHGHRVDSSGRGSWPPDLCGAHSQPHHRGRRAPAACCVFSVVP